MADLVKKVVSIEYIGDNLQLIKFQCKNTTLMEIEIRLLISNRDDYPIDTKKCLKNYFPKTIFLS